MNNKQSEIKNKLYGINDDHDTCAECGKTNLKRVMWIGLSDDSIDPVPYGTTCGARKLSVSATGGSKKVWSSVVDNGIAELHRARGEFVENECFIRANVAVPKPMIFIEFQDMVAGKMSMGEFIAIRDQQFPIMKGFDAGNFYNDFEALNARLEIARNAPSGLKVVRREN